MGDGPRNEIAGPRRDRIINEVRGINSVVYDVTSKPLGPGSAHFHAASASIIDVN